jgi:hypothetical protein
LGSSSAKLFDFGKHCLEPAAGAERAQFIATELLQAINFADNVAFIALHLGRQMISLPLFSGTSKESLAV